MSRFKDVKSEEMRDFINAPLKAKEPVGSPEKVLNKESQIFNTSINISLNVNTKKLRLESSPKSIKRRVFNMRLNNYYLQALEQLSHHDEGISMQQIAREILEKGLDALIKSKMEG